MKNADYYDYTNPACNIFCYGKYSVAGRAGDSCPRALHICLDGATNDSLWARKGPEGPLSATAGVLGL